MSISLQSWIKEKFNIEYSIERLKGIKKARLGYLGLRTIPEGLLELSLTELWLYKNKLESIPSNISNLQELMQLSLDDNKLTSLPDVILELRKLEILDLSYNRLTSLPELGLLKELRLLKIDHNKITSLPTSLLERIMDTNIRVYADHNKMIETKINGEKYTMLNNEYAYKGRIKFQQELDKSKIKHASELSNYHQ